VLAEELAGMRDGGKSIGIADLDKLAQVQLATVFAQRPCPLHN
jgi:hypothetical protein